MSAFTRVLGELLNPTRLPWQRRPTAGERPDCHPSPPRDPQPVEPPDPECTTGPDPRNLGKTFTR